MGTSLFGKVLPSHLIFGYIVAYKSDFVNTDSPNNRLSEDVIFYAVFKQIILLLFLPTPVWSSFAKESFSKILEKQNRSGLKPLLFNIRDNCQRATPFIILGANGFIICVFILICFYWLNMAQFCPYLPCTNANKCPFYAIFNILNKVSLFQLHKRK